MTQPKHFYHRETFQGHNRTLHQIVATDEVHEFLKSLNDPTIWFGQGSIIVDDSIMSLLNLKFR